MKKQPRQQQPVACWAINTGCPFIGVCLPSLGITAGARRLATKSSACLRIVAKPFSSMYSLSFCERWNRLRNADFESLSNKFVKSYFLFTAESYSLLSAELYSLLTSEQCFCKQKRRRKLQYLRELRPRRISKFFSL